jgi:L-lactate dehydrogenase (cytochrome)
VPIITTIEDLRVLAQKRVPRMFYDYADSGSWTEGTYRANSDDFQRIKLRQRVAVNMENRSTATTMVGCPVEDAGGIAPVGLTGMQHADGEIHAARAAEKFGIPFTLSTMSICSIEDIAENTSAPFWFQLYMMRDREAMARMIDRCKAAKCSALVLTLDLQVIGQRHKDLKNGLTAPPRPTLRNIDQPGDQAALVPGHGRHRRRTFRNLVGHVKGVSDMSSLAAWTNEQFDPRLSWADVAWVKERWGGKLILKGIMDVEDARLAVKLRRRCHRRQQPWRAPARWRTVEHRARCRPSSRRSAARPRSGWTAASAAARTCSRPGRWARAAR